MHFLFYRTCSIFSNSKMDIGVSLYVLSDFENCKSSNSEISVPLLPDLIPNHPSMALNDFMTPRTYISSILGILDFVKNTNQFLGLFYGHFRIKKSSQIIMHNLTAFTGFCFHLAGIRGHLFPNFVRV